ncbi:MAG: hypothetical protein PWP65_1322 [Clostridia bacterium]|nr:hypothetical protein [Clostridia bacterium]
MRSKFQLTALILLLVFLAASLLPAYGASELDELKNQQNRVQQEIQQKTNLLKAKDREGQELLEQLEALEAEIKAKEAEIAALEKQLAQAQARVEAAAAELARAEAAQEERMGIFRRRVKEIYINGRVDYLEVLLQSTSLTDFLVRVELLGKIAAGDMRLLEEIEKERRAIAARKSELEAQRNAIYALKRRTEGERLQLAARKEDRTKLLARIEEEKKAVAKALDELEALSQQIAVKIRELQARSRRPLGPRGTSQLAWPVPGYYDISSAFGWRVHPLLQTKRFHTGSDIPAPPGTDVVAVEDGVVISTGYLGAYGNHIVIDHGGGFSSMYAHLSAILVKDGQEVKRGQVIGRVGSTGWATGPHLHLEIRLDGEPTNPMNYY